MTDLIRVITPTIANAFAEAFRALSNDSPSYIDKNRAAIPSQPLSQGLHWIAHENKTQSDMWLRTKKARMEHETKCQEKFKSYLIESVKHRARWEPSSVQPLLAKELGWDIPSLPAAAPFPEEKDFASMLQYSLACNVHNRDRANQHLFTLSVTGDLIRDSHTLQHLVPIVEKGVEYYHSVRKHFEYTHMALVLLDGDPLRLQVLREGLQEKHFGGNFDVSHFYSYMGNYSRAGSTSQDEQFRQEIAHAVQHDITSPAPSMLGLGL